MSDLPFVDTAQEAVESAKQSVRQRLDWLEHFECTECGALCEADTQFVRSQSIPMPVWECPNCERRFYRSEESGNSFDMWR